MLEWSWWETNWLPSVLCHCCFGDCCESGQ